MPVVMAVVVIWASRNGLCGFTTVFQANGEGIADWWLGRVRMRKMGRWQGEVGKGCLVDQIDVSSKHT